MIPVKTLSVRSYQDAPEEIWEAAEDELAAEWGDCALSLDLARYFEREARKNLALHIDKIEEAERYTGFAADHAKYRAQCYYTLSMVYLAMGGYVRRELEN